MRRDRGRVLPERAFKGEPGLPCAVWIASNSSVPELTSHEPGSSQMAQGVFTNPNAVLPPACEDAEPCVCRLVHDSNSGQ